MKRDKILEYITKVIANPNLLTATVDMFDECMNPEKYCAHEFEPHYNNEGECMGRKCVYCDLTDETF